MTHSQDAGRRHNRRTDHDHHHDHRHDVEHGLGASHDMDYGLAASHDMDHGHRDDSALAGRGDPGSPLHPGTSASPGKASGVRSWFSGLPGKPGAHEVKHWFGDLLGTHSHDVADQLDDALEADTRGRRALWISLGILVATAVIQAGAVVLSGSVALLGDTLHNVSDALTAFPLLIAFGLARRPANDRFTYGYGRAEDLAGLCVVVMIAVSAVLAGYEAITRIANPRPVQHLWAVALAAVIGFCGNEIVAQYRMRVGRQIGSAALVADGLHARTDGLTSLAVLAGAGGVALGWQWADPVVGLLITGAILLVLRSAMAQVGARLMDAVNPALVARARAALAEVDGVHAVPTTRLRWIGHTLHAEAVIAVSPTATLAAAHDIAHAAQQHLVIALPRLTTASVHVTPQDADNCV